MPENAVVKDGDARYLWLVRDARVEKRAVKLGDSADGQVAVTDGLKGGEVIVVDPPSRLRDGAAVELQAATK